MNTLLETGVRGRTRSVDEFDFYSRKFWLVKPKAANLQTLLKPPKQIHNNPLLRFGRWDNFRLNPGKRASTSTTERHGRRLNNDFQFLDVARQDPEKKRFRSAKQVCGNL